MDTPKLACADVCDALGAEAEVVALPFRDFGALTCFNGPARTIRTLNDNSLLKVMLAEEGNGQVIVIDGGGSDRTALLGGNLAVLAVKNGWAGIIINGAVRDCHEIISEKVGVKAILSCPRRSEKTDRGSVDVPIELGGVRINPGDWITADGDGVVVTKEEPKL